MNVIDMHCDTIMRIFDAGREGSSAELQKNDFQIDIEKMQQGEYLLQNFAIYLDKETEESAYDTAKAMIACFYEEMNKNTDTIRPVTRYEEILENKENNLISALLTMEEGAPLEGSIEKLHEFYQSGVRMLTLTWNYPNEIGFPNAMFTDEGGQLLADQKGLTPAGIEIVQEMDRLGMIIDVSHGSDQLVKDVLKYSNRPFVASHSNARSVQHHFRNLSDELIKEIADRGGVIGINFSDGFLKDESDSTHLIEQIVAHVKHLKKIGGIEVVGMGSDFDGIRPHEDLPDARVFPKIYQALIDAGFTTDEVDQIFYKNVLRLYKEFLI